MKKMSFFKKAIALSGMAVISLNLIIPSPVNAEMKKFNMSYIFFGDSSLYQSYVERTNKSIQVISPNYFNIDDKGDLELEKIDRDFVKKMHKDNMKVVPFLSNHWDREIGRLALDNKRELAKDIVDAIEKYNLDGINVDLENLNEDDREDYTEFVKLLKRYMPSDKSISLAVAPNPYNVDKGWQGSFDYEELGKYSDYLVIMTYDESYPGGPEGPVSSLSFVEKSIENVLEVVPKEKVVLGIPFYGRLWKSDGEIRGLGVSLNKVEKLIKNYDSEVIYDEVAKSAKAIVRIKSHDEKPIVSYKKLEEGHYTIWFEDEKSIKEKLKLVKKYNLKGTASWSLGQETVDTWDYYDSWLNGKYIEDKFKDIKNHWAEEAILAMEEKSWMKGTSEEIFSPEQPLTRAQAAVTLVRALDIELEDSSSSFKDIDKEYWAIKEIEAAKKEGIIEGIEKGKFLPEEPITREQMAAMIDRIIEDNNEIKDMKNPFNDISKERWSFNSIMSMTDKGIFKGYKDDSFKPNAKLTRGQMAALMDRISLYIEE